MPGATRETHEHLLSGNGQLHIEIAVAKLKHRYHVDVILHPPKVPYRETILRPADGHGRHKKQTGGRGQFADCKIKIEPLPRGGDFAFEDEIFGGAIPQNYRPAVEKGIQEARRRGYLAGYPVVDFKVRLLDGQYHDVDSSELAFKIAGSLAFKDAMANAKPTILEPVMKVEIITSEEFIGDIMGDLSHRRGRPQGMDARQRQPGHQGPGADVGDARVRPHSARHDPGPLELPHGVLALRRGTAAGAGQAHRREPRSTSRRSTSRPSPPAPLPPPPYPPHRERGEKQRPLSRPLPIHLTGRGEKSRTTDHRRPSSRLLSFFSSTGEGGAGPGVRAFKASYFFAFLPSPGEVGREGAGEGPGVRARAGTGPGNRNPPPVVQSPVPARPPIRRPGPEFTRQSREIQP